MHSKMYCREDLFLGAADALTLQGFPGRKEPRSEAGTAVVARWGHICDGATFAFCDGGAHPSHTASASDPTLSQLQVHVDSIREQLVKLLCTKSCIVFTTHYPSLMTWMELGATISPNVTTTQQQWVLACLQRAGDAKI